MDLSPGSDGKKFVPSKNFFIGLFAVLALFFSTPWWLLPLLSNREETTATETPPIAMTTEKNDTVEPSKITPCAPGVKSALVYDKERGTLSMEKRDQSANNLLVVDGDYVVWQAKMSPDGRFIFFEIRPGPSCTTEESIAYRLDIARGVVARLFGTNDLGEGVHPSLFDVSPDGSRVTYGLFRCFACEPYPLPTIVVKVPELLAGSYSSSTVRDLGERVTDFVFTGNHSFTYYRYLSFYGENDFYDEPIVAIHRNEGPFAETF